MEGGGEDEFVAAVRQLRKVHNSQILELQRKYQEQHQVNEDIKKETDELREKVKRLKAVVKASKIKIVQQAEVISEQTILLREAKCPPPFHLTDSEMYSYGEAGGGSSQFPDSEQTFWPAQGLGNSHAGDGDPAAGECKRNQDNPNSEISSGHLTQQHIIYTHAHNNLARAGQINESREGETSSRSNNKTLSLKDNEENARVRYRERGTKTLLQSGKSSLHKWAAKNGSASDSDTVNGSDGDSRETSPSFLADMASRSLSAHNSSELVVGSKENPLEVDEPMSCSMFGASSVVTRLTPDSTTTPKRKRKNLEAIAEQLSSKKEKKAKQLKEAGKSLEAADILPMTPGVTAKVRTNVESDVNVVPVTPGIKSVDIIVGGGRRVTAKVLRSEKGNRHPIAAGSKGNGTGGGGGQSGAGGGGQAGKAAATSNTVTQKDKTDTLRKSRRIHSQRQPPNLDGNEGALALAKREGLPMNYKYDAKILKRSDRDKLDAKACPDCEQWYADDHLHHDKRSHLKHTCRHKALHLPPDSDSRMWDISFPNTEECNNINN